MGIIKRTRATAGGIIDPFLVKSLSKAAAELLPAGGGLPAAAIETLVNTFVQVAETAAVQMADRFAAQIVGRFADSEVVDALADKLTAKLADKFAERFQDEKFIAGLAGQFAAAFGNAMAETVAVVQLQRPAAKGKRGFSKQ